MKYSKNWACLALLVSMGSALLADENGAEKNPLSDVDSQSQLADDSQPTDLFAAMASGAVQVKFIPLSSEKANVQIKNPGNAAIDIRLPNAFGAVHVLAQAGGYGGGGLGGGGLGGGGLGGGGLGGGGGFGGGGGGQGLGGGFGGGGQGGGGLGGGGLGGGGFGGGGQGGGGGFFRLEPGKVKKLSVNTVCLEHGKPDPSPRLVYKLVPLEKLSTNPVLLNLCQRLGDGQVSQPVAQAAAWHLANGLSWQKLQSKNRHESLYTGNIRYFSDGELQQAIELARVCQRTAKELAVSLSSSSSGSLERF